MKLDDCLPRRGNTVKSCRSFSPKLTLEAWTSVQCRHRGWSVLAISSPTVEMDMKAKCRAMRPDVSVSQFEKPHAEASRLGDTSCRRSRPAGRSLSLLPVAADRRTPFTRVWVCPPTSCGTYGTVIAQVPVIASTSPSTTTRPPVFAAPTAPVEGSRTQPSVTSPPRPTGGLPR